MRKHFLVIPAAVFSVMVFTACGSGRRGSLAEGSTPAYEETEDGTDAGGKRGEPEDAPSSGEDGISAVSLDPALGAAVCDYLFDNAATGKQSGEIVIPGFIAVNADETDPEDIRVLGDFWYVVYDRQEDVLSSVAGREYFGCLHFRLEDGQYLFQNIDPVFPDEGEDAGKKLFGESFPAWKKIRSDYALREETRAQLIADYARAFGFSAAAYQDYGWNPLELPKPGPDKDNVFFYTAHGGMEAAEISVTADGEETQQEEVYVVKQGDTLGKIAGKYGVSVDDLAERNRDTIIRAARSQGIRSENLMRCADYIFPGEILAIP
ncbi:MAG: LysM peptidoglycan-binding domain-containing protein [Clostridium sp.]|nr:LysM peptidoglycan-binding domain-containing protein [Clostridium sp.]